MHKCIWSRLLPFGVLKNKKCLNTGVKIQILGISFSSLKCRGAFKVEKWKCYMLLNVTLYIPICTRPNNNAIPVKPRNDQNPIMQFQWSLEMIRTSVNSAWTPKWLCTLYCSSLIYTRQCAVYRSAGSWIAALFKNPAGASQSAEPYANWPLPAHPSHYLGSVWRQPIKGSVCWLDNAVSVLKGVLCIG